MFQLYSFILPDQEKNWASVVESSKRIHPFQFNERQYAFSAIQPCSEVWQKISTPQTRSDFSMERTDPPSPLPLAEELQLVL